MNTFEITKTEIFPIRARDGLIAFASVELNNSLTLESMGVKIGENGEIRITLPAKKVSASYKFYYSFKPEIKEKIIQAIQKEVDSSGLFGFIKPKI